MKIESSGKSVELAIQNGLLECGKKREEVEIKVIETGGLFKKAKVVLSWGESADSEEKTPNEPAPKQIETKEEREEPVEVKAEEPAAEKPKRLVNTDRLEARAKEFLLGLARLVDESATVQSKAGENEISFSISGNNLGKLIGYHGENIRELQFLLTGLKQRNEGPVRLYLDIDGYKFNRDQTISELANRVAEQAIKIERNIHLDPMSAYDRRIVHTTLQGREDVTTESTGEGEKRHVVIKPIFKH